MLRSKAKLLRLLTPSRGLQHLAIEIGCSIPIDLWVKDSRVRCRRPNFHNRWSGIHDGEPSYRYRPSHWEPETSQSIGLALCLSLRQWTANQIAVPNTIAELLSDANSRWRNNAAESCTSSGKMNALMSLSTTELPTNEEAIVMTDFPVAAELIYLVCDLRARPLKKLRNLLSSEGYRRHLCVLFPRGMKVVIKQIVQHVGGSEVQSFLCWRILINVSQGYWHFCDHRLLRKRC